MVEVKVSEDGMVAELALYPDSEKTLTADFVEDMLRMEGVQTGIDKRMIASLLSEELYDQFMPVAEGKPPVDGQDGYFEFFFETDKIVDVSEGELLAEYHTETKGTFGFNVFSKMLPPQMGKALPPLQCKNVRLEDNKYYAEKDGHVSLVDDTLAVQSVLLIEGDTLCGDGDIHFDGDICVKGDVSNGITLQASGTVIVEGFIENANVYAGLDVVVFQGIRGQGALKDGMLTQVDTDKSEIATVVEAKGKLNSGFIDHATVRAGGDIHIDYAVSSEISSDGKVTASGSKGSIAGGRVTALGGVDVEVLGTPSGLSTKVKVEGTAPIIVRGKICPNVKLSIGRIDLTDCSRKSDVEFRKISEEVFCKEVGTFQEEELSSGVVKNARKIAKEKPMILIIDDDSRMLRLLNEFLEFFYRVAVANSGKVARKYLEKNQADLILLDYMMPEENGVDVLKSLRANEETRDIPVIFLTALSDRKKIVECLAMNPAGYILKPVDRNDLIEKVQSVLGEELD